MLYALSLPPAPRTMQHSSDIVSWLDIRSCTPPFCISLSPSFSSLQQVSSTYFPPNDWLWVRESALRLDTAVYSNGYTYIWPLCRTRDCGYDSFRSRLQRYSWTSRAAAAREDRRARVDKSWSMKRGFYMARGSELWNEGYRMATDISQRQCKDVYNVRIHMLQCLKSFSRSIESWSRRARVKKNKKRWWEKRQSGKRRTEMKVPRTR